VAAGPESISYVGIIRGKSGAEVVRTDRRMPEMVTTDREMAE